MKYVVNVLLISLLLNTIIWAAILVFDDDEKNKNKREPEDATFLGRVIIIVHGQNAYMESTA